VFFERQSALEPNLPPEAQPPVPTIDEKGPEALPPGPSGQTLQH
jgi:hypothetical protein